MADKDKKTIIVSALYKFSELGANELIQTDKDAHDDPEGVPFFSFDASKQTFCAEVDSNDKHTMQEFLTRMAGYIEYQTSIEPAFDDEPRVYPMQGTVMEDIIPEDINNDQALLRYDSDTESSDGDVLEPMQHLTAYWKPRNGDISILLPMYAKEITRQTGSSLFAEEAEKRYRIFQGNFQLALEKLLRLEPLLEIFEKQSGNLSLPATGDLLIWPPNHEDSRLEYIHMHPDHPSFHRVIVNKQEQSLSRKVLGELRLLDPMTRLFEVPPNLQYVDIVATAECQASKVWKSSHYISFGTPENMEPIMTSNSNSPEGSDASTVQDPGDARITAWTHNVIRSADPEIAPEAPVEPTGPIRRRVVIESDSEDDEPTPTTKAVPTTNQAIKRTAVDQVSKGECLAETIQPAVESDTHSSLLSFSNLSNKTVLVKTSEGQDPMSENLATNEKNLKTLISIGEDHPDSTHSTEASGPVIPENWPGDNSTNMSNLMPSTSQSQPLVDLDGEAVPTIQGKQLAGAQGFSRLLHNRMPAIPENSPASPFANSDFENTAYGPSSPSHQGPQDLSNHNARSYGGIRAGEESSRCPEHAGPHIYAPKANSSRGSDIPDDLVDTQTPNTGNGTPVIPLGFESIVPLVPTKATTASSQVNRRGKATSRSSISGRSQASRFKFSADGSQYVTTHIPLVDQNAMREDNLRKAMALMAGRNKKAQEEDPPKKHSTMQQRAKNPSKKKETPAEAAARRKRVLEEAYGPTPTANSSPSKSASRKPEEMSQWKQKQMKKDTPMAKAHPEIVGDNLRDQETFKLVSLLQQSFEIARALKSKATFEIQVGQVLISPAQEMDQSFYSAEDWKSYFDARGSRRTFSTFTKILTSNGADIDRALEMKDSGRNDNFKLWDQSPSSQSVSYEFHCQSRSNEDFQIVVDELGGYELRKGVITVGTVNIHVPAQVWDLSATLSGPLEWSDPPQAVSESAKAFVESLYVSPDRKKLVLYFRPPSDHEIKVRNLIVKRVSYHASNKPDGQGILLKLTEAKTLQFRAHKLDKRLWQAYEPVTKAEQDYKFQIADKGCIHYEMSIVNGDINRVLAENDALQLGEQTDAETTGKSLLDRKVMRSILDTAIQVVSKIDFVGMWNYGTQKRLEAEKQAQEEHLGAILGPQARTILKVPGTSLARGSTLGLSRAHTSAGTNMGSTTVQQPVPGVRMKTEAEIMIDESGCRYLLGYGGARVPIAEEEEPLDSSETVAPDDSASQAGGWERLQLRAPYRSTDRGPGFW